MSHTVLFERDGQLVRRPRRLRLHARRPRAPVSALQLDRLRHALTALQRVAALLQRVPRLLRVPLRTPKPAAAAAAGPLRRSSAWRVERCKWAAMHADGEAQRRTAF
jgi:hypothetical protein